MVICLSDVVLSILGMNIIENLGLISQRLQGYHRWNLFNFGDLGKIIIPNGNYTNGNFS
jgi:hypothetical protein